MGANCPPAACLVALADGANPPVLADGVPVSHARDVMRDQARLVRPVACLILRWKQAGILIKAVNRSEMIRWALASLLIMTSNHVRWIFAAGCIWTLSLVQLHILYSGILPVAIYSILLTLRQSPLGFCHC